MPSFVADE
jgi:hypothetical protein